MTFSQPPAGNAYPSSPGLQCPKCRGFMRTYERNGVHIEQCDGCRGIFLDFGELEHLVQMEGRHLGQPTAMPQSAPSYPPQSFPPPAGYRPDWGYRGDRNDHHDRRKGIRGLFFSS